MDIPRASPKATVSLMIGVNKISIAYASPAARGRKIMGNLVPYQKIWRAGANEADPENHGLLPEELEAAIRESMENGAKGICLFTPGRMTDADWEVLKKAIHKDFRSK